MRSRGNIRDLEAIHRRVRALDCAPRALDARQTVQGAPEVARALGAAARLAYRRRHDFVRSRESRPAAIRFDGAGLQSRGAGHLGLRRPRLIGTPKQEALRGNSYSLVAGSP